VTSGDKIKGLRGLANCRLGLRMVKADDGDGTGGIAAKRKGASSDEVSEPGVVADGAEMAEQGLGESATDLGGGPGAREKIEPVLSPDPLASALTLALIGGGIAAANGAIPQVSGPIADALSALGGGVPFSKTILGNFMIGATSAMIAEAIAFPFDSLKTRMQLQGVGAGSAASNLSPFQQAFALYYGVGIALFRHIPYSGTRQMLYQTGKGMLEGGQGGAHVVALGTLAMSAGAIGQLIANPTDVLKVRMQSDGRKVNQGLDPEYRSVWDAVARVWKEEGVEGMMVGAVPNMVRAVFMNLGDICVYDTVKVLSIPYTGGGLASEVLASATCGFATAILASPAEVARNRMMNNGPSSPAPLYDNLIDCVKKTYAQGGVGEFFKGIVPFYMRNGPWHLAFWLSFESLGQFADSAIPHL